MALARGDLEQRLPANTWVVVPAYNEERRLGAVLAELMALAATTVVVDDGSTDGTSRQAADYPVWLVRHGVNLGQGAALQTGIDFALAHGAAFIVTFDADGQHATADIGPLVAALASGAADYALGSRFLGRAEGMPASRRWMLKLAVAFTRWTTGLRLTDTHNGLRAMSRRGAERIRLTLNRMEHASQLLDQIAASGLGYVEVPVSVKYTAESLSKGQPSSAAVRLAAKLLVEKLFR